mmetsp:Transcript_8170/g.17887  ORF Transcript_8170/g.17887 Transcript_8170/m.17887 type:complete len:156 (+) Transcript_8170:204-671(+)
MSSSEEGEEGLFAPATSEIQRERAVPVDVKNNRFPYSVVWGPLCPLTCCCPCVGHMGIGDSTGRIHDFNGPYSIGVDDFMVGAVWRYAVVSGPGDSGWDEAIHSADSKYETKMHNICCENCHHHTAYALTKAGRPHGMISSLLLCCLQGKCTWCT